MEDKRSSHKPFNKRYTILSTLGEGGMGRVLLAQDNELNRNVAIKVIKAEVASDRDILKRTGLEGKLLSKLSHPSLAHVYEMDMHCSHPYIVQEFVEGESLRSRIDSGRLFSADTAIRLLKEQAEVLSYLHDKKIYHRDIKPENIMITPSGKSVLMDFGLALEESRTRFTADGSYVGTFVYCAPEVLQGKDGGPQADVFQLGFTVYEALTNRYLYGDFESMDEFVSLVYSRTWESQRFCSKVPSSLGTIIKKCCAYSSQDRPQNGSELVKLINEVLHQKDTTRRPTKKPALEASRKRVPPNKNHAEATDSGQRTRVHVLALATLCFLSALFMIFSIRPKDAVVDLLKTAREHVFLPHGLYLFLPSATGNHLRWEATTTKKGYPDRTFSGAFEKVAGGWKTTLLSNAVLPDSTITFTVLDSNKTVGTFTRKLPATPLREPLTVLPSFDRMLVKWELHGQCTSRISVRSVSSPNSGTSDTLLCQKQTNRTDTIISKEELGKANSTMEVHLVIPSLKEQTEPLASTRTTLGLNLKYQLSHSASNEEMNFAAEIGNNTIHPTAAIRTMDMYEDTIYLTTRSGHLKCLKVDSQRPNMITKLWEKDLRDLPAFTLVPKVYDRECPVFLNASTVLAYKGGVTIFGLKEKAYAFAANGQVQSFELINDTLMNLLSSANSDDGRIIHSICGASLASHCWESKGRSHIVVTGYSSPNGPFSSMLPQQESTEYRVDQAVFTRKAIYWILAGSADTKIQWMPTPDTSEKTTPRISTVKTMNTPLANEERASCIAQSSEPPYVLAGINNHLVLIEDRDREPVVTVYKNISGKAATIKGLIGIGKNEYLALSTTASSSGTFGGSVQNLGFQYLKVNNGTVSLAREVALSESIVVELNECRVLGPVKIANDKIAFTAGLSFFIAEISTGQILYRKDFFAAPERIFAKDGFVIVSKFSNGTFFGMPLYD